MAYRKILMVNNEQELEILRKKSKPVENFDARLSIILDDMKETMFKADGAGLSAVQIGILKNMFIILLDGGIVEFINPEIISTSKETKIDNEGCLSVPKKYGKVKRPIEIKVKAQDITGKVFERTLQNFEAREFCHEYDHLLGILYTDRVEKDDNNVPKGW